MKHNFNHSEISQAIITATDKHPDLINVHYSAVQEILSLLPEPGLQVSTSQAIEAWDAAQQEFGMFGEWEGLARKLQNQLAQFLVNVYHISRVQPEVVAFDDVQPGDRVKLIINTGSIYEVEVKHIDGSIIEWPGSSVRLDRVLRIELVERATQPAPDPEEHLVIMVEKITSMEFQEPRQAFWDGQEYLIQGWQNRLFGCMPEKIIKWKPAEVVAKVVADD